MRPLGVLGGTFDPVHNAHLALARAALATLDLEQILWIPTGAPGYRPPPVAAARHRLAMLELALAGASAYAIDRRELAPEASGYTVDTLAALRREFGSTQPFVLLMGADQYARLQSWHRWQELLQDCRVAVFARPGWLAADQGAQWIPFEPLGISASDIRRRIARGDEVSAMLPAAVLAYIRDHHLYGHP